MAFLTPDLGSLHQELTRKWGEDAAQHALMRIVEKGWHLDPGDNRVDRFARVVAMHYALDQKTERTRHRTADLPPDEWDLPQDPEQERITLARERLHELGPAALALAVTGSYAGAGELLGVAEGTIKSRVHRAKRRVSQG